MQSRVALHPFCNTSAFPQGQFFYRQKQQAGRPTLSHTPARDTALSALADIWAWRYNRSKRQWNSWGLAVLYFSRFLFLIALLPALLPSAAVAQRASIVWENDVIGQTDRDYT